MLGASRARTRVDLAHGGEPHGLRGATPAQASRVISTVTKRREELGPA